jgi:hypothetical protein
MKLTITHPANWSEIKLVDYIKYYKHIKPWEGLPEYSEKAILTAVLYFSKVPAEYYLSLPKKAYDRVEATITNLLTSINDQILVRTFTVEDQEYGFIPALDEMTYGEYLDLISYTKNNLWENMPTIMSILYRPITKKLGKNYQIQAYSGTNEDRVELFKHIMTMDVVFGAVAFFLNLQKDLLDATLTYSMEILKTTKDKEILAALADLEKNGVDITQLQSLLTMTSQSLTK